MDGENMIQRKAEEEFVCPFCWDGGAGRVAFGNEEELCQHFREKHMKRITKMPSPVKIRRLSSLVGGLISGFLFGALFAAIVFISAFPTYTVPFAIIVTIIILAMAGVAFLDYEIHSALADQGF
jgi:uncharacterized protein YacL